QRELQTLSTLEHPNIVKLIGASSLSDQVILLTEFCNAGSLFRALHDMQEVVYEMPWVCRISREVASGMAYLHSQHILHRDLKSQNVLLHSTVHARICDFGLAKQSDHMTKMTGTPGTPAWMAPEVIRAEPSGMPSDVYSFAIVLWEIVCRQVPWQGMEATQVLFAVAAFNKRPPIPQDCPANLQELIRACWD
ncbi:uncharacterized protein MONBRDRAFT_2266, partial [Monosiga brevicollis MX1]